MFRRISWATRFVQEPGPPLGFIHPHLDKTCGSDVAMFLADIVGLTQTERERLVVLAKFGKHVAGLDELRVVIRDPLQSRYVPNGSDSEPAQLSDALGNGIGHGKKLVSLLIQEQMVIAEVRATHVPMEILGLEIEGEDVR